MLRKGNNVAYIDAANLHHGCKSLGWELDYKRLRVWLKEKYAVQVAYLFIGLIPKYKNLYMKLQSDGYTLVYKEVVYDGKGKPKGNCDADLVLQATRDVFESSFDKAVVVTSDGDYSSLVSFLLERERLVAVVSPGETEKCSVLLKRTNAKISYLIDQRTHLELQKRKSPR